MTTRIAIVTGTRADFGLWRPVLAELGRRGPEVEVGLLVMGMHLDPRFGHTVDEVRASGVPIIGEVPFTPTGDSAAEMAGSLGTAIERAAPILATHAPDWLLVLGDRGEQLAAALVALHLGTAVAHLHGGERTAGAVDDVLRDLVSRIAHLHLVATESAAARLAAMSVDPWRIRRTGAPGLDGLAATGDGASPGLRARYGLPPAGPYLLLVVHPETGPDSAAPQALVDAILGATRSLDMPALAIWPNADAGGRAIAARLEAAETTLAGLHASIPRDDYIGLLGGAAVLVGNSSSGIIEAPLLRVPAVNVGRRQEGRDRGDNVIDVPPSVDAVRAAMREAVTPAFRARLSGRSPYGDGAAASRIVDAILGTPIDARLLGRDGA
jgi:UDP-hydrolysing UDP-N-acetyl-D-glucosamine 2-epimerase